mmetsp:Transcript_8159/g.18243  ORF Transcript_8159/g.18243 Transcript_8159/m.18243 type:complete len:204 (-) Transcript_8159:543-1154(-)
MGSYSNELANLGDQELNLVHSSQVSQCRIVIGTNFDSGSFQTQYLSLHSHEISLNDFNSVTNHQSTIVGSPRCKACLPLKFTQFAQERSCHLRPFVFVFLVTIIVAITVSCPGLVTESLQLIQGGRIICCTGFYNRPDSHLLEQITIVVIVAVVKITHDIVHPRKALPESVLSHGGNFLRVIELLGRPDGASAYLCFLRGEVR